MKDKLPKGRAFRSTKDDVGTGKVKRGGKKAQSEITDYLNKNRKKK